jgi:hypothetical protein
MQHGRVADSYGLESRFKVLHGQISSARSAPTWPDTCSIAARSDAVYEWCDGQFAAQLLNSSSDPPTMKACILSSSIPGKVISVNQRSRLAQCVLDTGIGRIFACTLGSRGCNKGQPCRDGEHRRKGPLPKRQEKGVVELVD